MARPGSSSGSFTCTPLVISRSQRRPATSTPAFTRRDEIARRLQHLEEFGQALLRALAHDEGQAEIAFVAQFVDGDAVFRDHRARGRRAATARAACAPRPR